MFFCLITSISQCSRVILDICFPFLLIIRYRLPDRCSSVVPEMLVRLCIRIRGWLCIHAMSNKKYSKFLIFNFSCFY